MDLPFWRTTAIAIAAVGQTLFVILYLTFPWWNSLLGRALFIKAACFAALLDAAWLSRTIGDWPGKDGMFIVLYLLFAVSVWGQLIAFIRAASDLKEENQ